MHCYYLLITMLCASKDDKRVKGGVSNGKICIWISLMSSFIICTYKETEELMIFKITSLSANKSILLFILHSKRVVSVGRNILFFSVCSQENYDET